MGLRESAELPTSAKDVLAMFVQWGLASGDGQSLLLHEAFDRSRRRQNRSWKRVGDFG
jgi:hypothetical protein